MQSVDVVIDEFHKRTGRSITADDIERNAVLIEQIDKNIGGEPGIETLYALPTSFEDKTGCVLYREQSRCIVDCDGDINEFVTIGYELF